MKFTNNSTQWGKRMCDQQQPIDDYHSETMSIPTYMKI